MQQPNKNSQSVCKKRKSSDEFELVARRLLGNKIVSPPLRRGLLSDWQLSDYFRSQADALDYYRRCCHGNSLESAKPPPLVMSSESQSLGCQGQRLYFVCDLQTGIDYLLGHPVGRRHLYELIPEGARCRLYLDLEFDRTANPSLDGSRATEILIEFLRTLLQLTFNSPPSDSQSSNSVAHQSGESAAAAVDVDCREAVQLDASTEQKFSRHVIFPNVVFANNELLGRFLRFAYSLLMEWLALDVLADDLDHQLPVYKLTGGDILCSACHQLKSRALTWLESSAATAADLQLLFPAAPSDPQSPNRRAFLADLSVYSRNRNFRTAYSAKLAKPKSPLLPWPPSNWLDEAAEDSSAAANVLRRTLVTPLPYNSTPVLSAPAECGAGRCFLFESRGASLVGNSNLPQLARRGHLSGSSEPGFRSAFDGQQVLQGRPPSPYPEIDRHFIVSVMSNQAQLRMWSYNPANQILTLYPSNHRYCHRIERNHRSNHVYFLVSLADQAYEQRCFDPDCARYRSNWFSLPSSLFPWNFQFD